MGVPLLYLFFLRKNGGAPMAPHPPEIQAQTLPLTQTN